jgi:hypothetical protein
LVPPNQRPTPFARARRNAATVGHSSTMSINVSIVFLTLGGLGRLGVVELQECALTRDTSLC